MIETHEGLLLSIEQMARMYCALADLHTRVAPLNFRNYQVFAEGPIDEIRKLQREIDEYLGIAEPVTAVNRS